MIATTPVTRLDPTLSERAAEVEDRVETALLAIEPDATMATPLPTDRMLLLVTEALDAAAERAAVGRDAVAEVCAAGAAAVPRPALSHCCSSSE